MLGPNLLLRGQNTAGKRLNIAVIGASGKGTVDTGKVALDHNIVALVDVDSKRLADAGKALDKKMTEVEEVLIQTKAKSGQDVLNFPVRLNNDIAALGGVVGSADSAPTQQSYEVDELLSQRLNEQLVKWNQIQSTDIPAYNNLVKQQEVPAVKVTVPESGQ